MVTHQEIVEFFDKQQECWRNRDYEALARGYTQDAVIVSPIFRTVTGSPALAAFPLCAAARFSAPAQTNAAVTYVLDFIRHLPQPYV